MAIRLVLKTSALRGLQVRVLHPPPIFRIRILGDCCLAPPEAWLGFRQDFEGIFEIQKQFLPAQTEVRFAEGKHKFEKFINQSFSFAFGERQSDNLILQKSTDEVGRPRLPIADEVSLS